MYIFTFTLPSNWMPSAAKIGGCLNAPAIPAAIACLSIVYKAHFLSTSRIFDWPNTVLYTTHRDIALAHQMFQYFAMYI